MAGVCLYFILFILKESSSRSVDSLSPTTLEQTYRFRSYRSLLLTNLKMQWNFVALAAVALAITAPFAALATVPPEADNPELRCKPFEQIYSSGKDLCERIFGDSFLYVNTTNTTEYNLAYTMWFFSFDNPNDITTDQRRTAGLFSDPSYSTTDQCWLRTPGVTNHKEAPSDESATFTECLPFRQNACCKESTVENATVINQAYGAEYRWDRCGKLSPECERFFVQEACLYECDPNAGLYRKFPPKAVLADPTLAEEAWAIQRMPIKGDYCDAWFESCRQQLFCGDGDFFTCKRVPPPGPPPQTVLPPGAIAGAVIGSVVLFLTLVFLIVLIHRERRGTPVFLKISAEDSRPLEKPFSDSARRPTPATAGSDRDVVNI